MRPIDAEELETEILFLWDTEKFDNIKDVTVELTDVMWRVYRAPTVDAVPVVRCKDCVWYEISELTMDGRPDRRHKPSFCALQKEFMNQTDYCSYGEKKENETD